MWLLSLPLMDIDSGLNGLSWVSGGTCAHTLDACLTVAAWRIGSIRRALILEACGAAPWRARTRAVVLLHRATGVPRRGWRNICRCRTVTQHAVCVLSAYVWRMHKLNVNVDVNVDIDSGSLGAARFHVATTGL